jgi:hypothetical protein
MEVGRTAFGDGQPPAYVFASPCCGAISVLAAWIIEYAVARTNGRLLIECGRYTADPLRTVRAAGTGCGRRYVVLIQAPEERGTRGRSQSVSTRRFPDRANG